MDHNPFALLEKTGKIIRRSIFTLLKDFQHYCTAPVVLMLPFSVSVLLLQSVYRSCSQTNPLLFPARASFLGVNLCQVIFSYIFSFPLTLTFLVIAKGSIIRHLNQYRMATLPFYKTLILTCLCNIIFTVSSSLVAFFLLLTVLSLTEEAFGLASSNPLLIEAAQIVLYMILTNTMVISNLALAVAGTGNSTGYRAICRVALLRKQTNSMALLLTIPVNLGLAAIESLFRYRVIRAYYLLGRLSLSMVMESLLIAYMFSLLIVLETIASCLFIMDCEPNSGREQAETFPSQIAPCKVENNMSESLKEFP
ncbi:hypothetical protein K2173_013974 [Erythroxylum novogranatense]|uniref:Uncharacterized protein n=1 Tax=Erythroxylum novogranatense TaxID=1862640 RepID=A0AAV8SDD6_9ROSI|nr:hypothetical protein K2173_013974 [Erythroxylum novogranatense]